MLYTTLEFAYYIGATGVDQINVNRAELIRDLVEQDIQLVIGEARFTATDPLKLKGIALDLAKRSYQNERGLRSLQESIDDYSKMETYATETVAPPELTEDERRRIRRAAGLRAVFTITPTSPPPPAPCVPGPLM